MLVTPVVRPTTSTGAFASAVEPLPSSPWVFEPQHFAAPLTTAQAYPVPVLMAVTPEVSPVT
jgi:hypothetical protein